MVANVIPSYGGTTPSRTQTPSAFATNADAWLTYMDGIEVDYNSLGTYLDGVAVTVDTDAATAAAAALSAPASANFAGAWSVLTGALNIPASVSHNGISWLLISNLADVTTKEPGVNIEWQAIDANFFQPLKTADFTAAAGLEYQIEATVAADITMPTIADGEKFTFHNSNASTATVLVLNPSYSIRGPAGSISSGTDLELAAGDTVVLVARSTTIFEVA